MADTARPDLRDTITDSKEYSSLPVALALSGVVVLTMAGGWLLQRNDTLDPIDDVDDATLLAITPDATSAETPTIDIDSELRKARLAADANILVFPPEQSALHYYSRVMAADPQDLVANAEFDAVLSQISRLVAAHVAAGEFDAAYELAAEVARHKPEHAIVKDTRRALDDYATRLVERATQHAREGEDNAALAVLVTVEDLPGISSTYLAAARQSIDAAQQSRVAAEQERLELARVADELATAEWTESVRSAIAAGRLIAPHGGSARDHLTERDTPAETKEQLTNELVEALMAVAQQYVEVGDLPDAEAHLEAVDDLGVYRTDLTELRGTLERQLVEAEGNRVLGLSDFVQLDSPPPRYPGEAERRNLTGWVELVFTVTPAGTTADIEVLQAVPQNVFESSAIKAVEKWTFEPREYRGQAISQRTAAKVVFDLQ